jgi:DNA replication protein DnaC
MLHNQTVDKLRDLRLEGMAQALEEQRHQRDIADLDFETRLALLIDRQALWKENRGLTARLKEARFKISASLEDIDYRHPRNLKRAQIEQLRVCGWVKEHRSCLITGSTGTGKTHLSCALGHQACRDGFRTFSYGATKFFRELHTAQADGSLAQRLKKLARVPLLVIDDLGIDGISARQCRDLLEVLDDRQGQGATLITSQYPVGQWHQMMADATVADAILDRLVHNAYRLELKGETMRKNKSSTAPPDTDKQG